MVYVYEDVFRKYMKVGCVRLIVVFSGENNNINLTQVPIKCPHTIERI